jgi:hypothetical protein
MATSKKHMMMGGNPAMATTMPMKRAMMRRPMATEAGATPMPMMRKKGGEVESPKEHKAEMSKMRKVEKELKHHESMKAGKAHHGLKNGGMAPKAGPDTMGGLAGGLEATRTNKKKTTGNIELSKYKMGGLAAKGMAVARKYETKINDGSRMKAVKGGTGGIEGSKFKKGGLASKGMAIANKYQTKINDASKVKTVKGGTGGIEGSKFKDGGHVTMSCKNDGGFITMKKMQKC